MCNSVNSSDKITPYLSYVLISEAKIILHIYNTETLKTPNISFVAHLLYGNVIIYGIFYLLFKNFICSKFCFHLLLFNACS